MPALQPSSLCCVYGFSCKVHKETGFACLFLFTVFSNLLKGATCILHKGEETLGTKDLLKKCLTNSKYNRYSNKVKTTDCNLDINIK